MRKVLLGTTALVAAAAFASVGAVQADEMMAEPVSVGVGGYTTGAVGMASDGADDNRNHEISYVYEIGVSGSTTLDNGITVAVSGQIGRSAGDDEGMDEIHTTLSGSFGSIRLGRTESAAFNSTTAAPGAGIGGMLGVNYSWFTTAAPTVNTYSGLGAEDALKVVYTSPNFNGLTVGLSYAPNDADTNFTGRGIDDGQGQHVAVGVTYSTDFMEGGSLSFGAGFETAAADAGMDPEAMRAGVNVSFDQISLGGSMYDDENTSSAGMAFDVGASWTEGPWEMGLQYGADENNGDKGETTKTALHLTYTLGPGVLIGGQAAAGSSDSAEDVTQFMLGTAVFF